jgi:hypothetical protein
LLRGADPAPYCAEAASNSDEGCADLDGLLAVADDDGLIGRGDIISEGELDALGRDGDEEDMIVRDARAGLV